MASSAFLSTENDLHHNLRPNIGGHTSRHNNRVPSEILNGQGGYFKKKGDGMGEREIRLKIVKEKAEREKKGKRVQHTAANVIIIVTLIIVIIA